MLFFHALLFRVPVAVSSTFCADTPRFRQLLIFPLRRQINYIVSVWIFNIIAFYSFLDLTLSLLWQWINNFLSYGQSSGSSSYHNWLNKTYKDHSLVSHTSIGIFQYYLLKLLFYLLQNLSDLICVFLNTIIIHIIIVQIIFLYYYFNSF